MASKDDPKIITGVKSCARCGEDHEPLCFLKLKRPGQNGAEGITHWTSCPTTGEPILLGVYET